MAAHAVAAATRSGGGTDRLMVFSADTHVGPHPRHLRPYCPQQYLEAYDEFVERSEAIFNATFEATAFSEEYRAGRRRNALTEGHFDPAAWMRDMDRDGVAGGVVFHDSLNGQPMPFDIQHAFANTIPLPEDARAGGGRSHDVQPLARRLRARRRAVAHSAWRSCPSGTSTRRSPNSNGARSTASVGSTSRRRDSQV